MNGAGVFPYDLVKKNNNIIIYGLGMIGRGYIEQIKITDYCNIVAVSDKKRPDNDCVYKYIEPKQLCNENFDYIVISVADIDISTDIFWELIRLNVKREKIISNHLSRSVFFPRYTPEDVKIMENEEENLKIAITLDGGLGDFIIALSFIRRLKELVSNIQIDIYGKKWISDVIFGTEDYISGIYFADTGIENPDKFERRYDVAFRILFVVRVEYINHYSVKHKSKELYEKIILSMNDSRINDIKHTTDLFLEIHQRAKKLGFNRYQFLGQGDIWNLSAEKSKLYLAEKYEDKFKELNLGRYITFNYGASNVPGQEGRTQTKVWSRYNFCRFITVLKKEYPDIKVIQLGDKNSNVIEEADLSLIDNNLELVKHILANAVFHLDGEGGLVHMATQLGTKCVVLFGPTPVWFYGYSSNINIVSDVCGDCCHLKHTWYTVCLLNSGAARCMEAITVDRVMDEVRPLLII